jgi:hypothetical protein
MLLWEPRKNEEGDDSPFLSRHSFLAAQHGYALPKILMVALGKSIEIAASPRGVPLADVQFKQRAHVSCARGIVEEQLTNFVQSVVDRLNERRVNESWLQDTWAMILETGPEEQQFCQFAGALGLSPYDIDDTIAGMLERLQPELGDGFLMDLCLAATAEKFPGMALIAQQAHEIVGNAPASTLLPIASIEPPKENLSLPAYRRGVQAAHLLRKRLGISDTDMRGATKIFERFEIDTTLRAPLSSNSVSDQTAVTGAVLRNENLMKVGLLQEKETKRRFAGARAIFSAWSSEGLSETRLLTSAVTRDQQANRAFAAELTAPQALVKSWAKSGRLSASALFDLAAELQISADVVAKRASDMQIRVPPI